MFFFETRIKGHMSQPYHFNKIKSMLCWAFNIVLVVM